MVEKVAGSVSNKIKDNKAKLSYQEANNAFFFHAYQNNNPSNKCLSKYQEMKQFGKRRKLLTDDVLNASRRQFAQMNDSGSLIMHSLIK